MRMRTCVGGGMVRRRTCVVCSVRVRKCALLPVCYMLCVCVCVGGGVLEEIVYGGGEV